MAVQYVARIKDRKNAPWRRNVSRFMQCSKVKHVIIAYSNCKMHVYLLMFITCSHTGSLPDRPLRPRVECFVCQGFRQLEARSAFDRCDPNRPTMPNFQRPPEVSVQHPTTSLSLKFRMLQSSSTSSHLQFPPIHHYRFFLKYTYMKTLVPGGCYTLFLW